MKFQKDLISWKLLLILVVLSFNSCVSQKEWNELLDRKNTLESSLKYEDSDEDGIRDRFDWEPDTPLGAKVDPRGITLDSDNDGVADYRDKDPFSPPGYNVNSEGVSQIPTPDVMEESDFYQMLESQFKDLASAGPEAGPIGPEHYTLRLPLPLASTSFHVPLSFFAEVKNFDGINEVLEKELKIAGFDSDLRYFLVEDHANKKSGYAIITPVEVIDAAAVRQDWWSPEYDELQISSLRDLFSALLFMKVGYSRLMIILVTEAKIIDRPEKTKSSEQIRGELYSKYNNGLRYFSDLEIGSETKSDSLKCEILIYEFQRLQKEDRVISIQPKVDAKKHLKGAQLDALLKQ